MKDHYHYTECGLDNIWLADGFAFSDSPAGRTLKIQNIEGLHDAIGKMLIKKKRWTGQELRFIRQELLLSQARLAKLLDVGEQTVHRWEKGKTDLSPSAETLIRFLYIQKLTDADKLNVRSRLEELADLENEIAHQMVTATKTKNDWQLDLNLAA